VLLGFIQGVLLWLVKRWSDGMPAQWPSWPWVYAVGAACAVGPLSWWFMRGSLGGGRRRLGVSVAAAVLFALLAAYLAKQAQFTPAHFPQPDRLLAMALAGFMLVALAASFDAARRRFDYPHLFELAWRNGMLFIVGLAMTGLLWMVLVVGAKLLGLVGLPQLLRLLQVDAWQFIVTCSAFGTSVSLALRKSQLLLSVRSSCLTLLAWFLPLALAFAVVWTIALPFAGLSTLLASHQTGFIMLWFCSLTVVFVNAAYQGGEEAPPYPRALSLALRWSFLAMIVVIAVADYALWERVHHFGLTEDRIWGLLAAAALSLYVLGYAASGLARRRGWMAAVPVTNVVVAVLLVLALLALSGPVADVSRLAVRDQMQRLQAGRVDAQGFDWNYLAWRSGRAGTEALQRMAAEAGSSDAVRRDLAERARIALAQRDKPAAASDPREARESWRRQVAVWPAGASVDDAALDALIDDSKRSAAKVCPLHPGTCALWSTDADGDGRNEIVLFNQIAAGRTDMLLYAHEPDGWRRQGSNPLPLAASLEAIGRDVAEGRAHWRAPRWRELQLESSQNEAAAKGPARPPASR
jgi:hypothetical protein